MSAKTKAKVLAVIEAENYTPNIFARGLGLNSIKMVGILCTDVSDLFYAKAVSVIESSLKQHGFDTVLFCSGNKLEDKKISIDNILAKRVDALILIGSAFKEEKDNSHIEKVSLQMPTIIINGIIDLPHTYCITCDEYQAMYHNVSMLYTKGCKDILYLYDVDTYSSRQKLEGYRAAFKDLNLSFCPDLVLKVPKNKAQIIQVVSTLIDQGTIPDAILASEDYLAINGMHALISKGYSIPSDMPVIGFNNSILCECCLPTLTSVDNMVDTLCTTAVNILTDIFSGKSVSHILSLSAKLVERDSFKL